MDSPDVIFVMLPTTPTEIWSYDPVINEFEHFTTVECTEVEGYYTGFGLDRDGYVVLLSLEPEDPAILPYPAMQLTRFDPVSGSCDELFYGAMANGPFGVDCADVAFVSVVDEPDHERLFAHACTGGGFTVVPGSGIGPLFRMDLADDDPAFALLDADDYTSVALAGTGDGRLYGVGGDQKLPGVGQIIEYDQESGAILSNETVPGLDIGDQGAYIALAFYGGDLYTFGLSTPDFSLEIRQYDLDDDDGDGVNEVTEIETPASSPGGIIAAASPTCIPLTPAGSGRRASPRRMSARRGRRRANDDASLCRFHQHHAVPQDHLLARHGVSREDAVDLLAFTTKGQLQQQREATVVVVVEARAVEGDLETGGRGGRGARNQLDPLAIGAADHRPLDGTASLAHTAPLATARRLDVEPRPAVVVGDRSRVTLAIEGVGVEPGEVLVRSAALGVAAAGDHGDALVVRSTGTVRSVDLPVVAPFGALGCTGTTRGRWLAGRDGRGLDGTPRCWLCGGACHEQASQPKSPAAAPMTTHAGDCSEPVAWLHA